MLEFKTSARENADEPITFKIDGEEYTAYPPKDTALAFLAAASAGNSTGEQLREVLSFLRDTLDQDSQERLFARLRDPLDDMTMVDATNILSGLIKEFSGRPTE